MADILAIYVVLRPDRATEELAIRLSESLLADRPFTLNRTDRLPHCSLFMAHVRASDIPEIATTSAPIAAATHPLSIAAELETYESPVRPTLSGLLLERVPALQQLHESIVSALRDFGGLEPSDAAQGLPSDRSIMLPTEARFNRLALCQLGNWNTCRRILAEWPLTISS